jgi:hypothetical protein
MANFQRDIPHKSADLMCADMQRGSSDGCHQVQPKGGEGWQTGGKRGIGQVGLVLVTPWMFSKETRYTHLASEEDHMRGNIRKRYKDSWNIILDIVLR